MTKRRIANVAASNRERLRQRAHETKRPFADLLQYFAMERFLFRLSQSAHAAKFILKGGLLLAAWQAPTRPTRDIDLMGLLPNDLKVVTEVFREVCQQPVEPDGLFFDAKSVRGEMIREDADYEGVRVNFDGTLDRAKIKMQIDVGFGDAIEPPPVHSDLPTQIGHPSPRLRTYPKEAVIAEKLEAMVKLDMVNSRMKDFFDIWLLSQRFDFEGRILARAIQATFTKRRTSLGTTPIALTLEFANDQGKAKQWKSFLRNGEITIAPQELPEVIEHLESFLCPPLAAISQSKPFLAAWKAPGPWAEAAGSET